MTKKTCGNFKGNKKTSILNPSKDIFTDYLEYKINNNGIVIVTKNNYRLNLYIQHIRKKVPLDYAEIHPALLNFYKITLKIKKPHNEVF